MGMSDYVAKLRACVGNDLLVLASAGACIRDERGRILLLRRSDGLWSVPGGGLEPGERLDQAVVREVREETGLEVEPTALIGVYSDPEYIFTYPNGHQVQPITTSYLRILNARFGFVSVISLIKSSLTPSLRRRGRNPLTR
jgi:8-oxo-dGTP pyrophosphatase MutT (NUDIX family)